MVTCLQGYAEAYQKCYRMISDNKHIGRSINDDSIYIEKSTLLYNLWKAKQNYVMFYHGTVMYTLLHNNYTTALRNTLCISDTTTNERVTILSNYERRCRPALYQCVLDLISTI